MLRKFLQYSRVFVLSLFYFDYFIHFLNELESFGEGIESTVILLKVTVMQVYFARQCLVNIVTT